MKMRRKNTDKVSMLVGPFPWVVLGAVRALATALFFLGSFEMHYLSHPCHIQGHALRCFDILTATEDGHNLQRHSTQAGSGSSRGKTVSWTTAVRKVSNQGQEEKGKRGQKAQPGFPFFWFWLNLDPSDFARLHLYKDYTGMSLTNNHSLSFSTTLSGLFMWDNELIKTARDVVINPGTCRSWLRQVEDMGGWLQQHLKRGLSGSKPHPLFLSRKIGSMSHRAGH